MPCRRALNLLLLSLILATAWPPGLGAERLRAGAAVESALEPGARHAHEIELVAGDSGWVRVEQRGIDVELVLQPPGGEPISVDGPFDRHGAEYLWIKADASGVHRLEVVSREPSALAGRYLLHFTKLDGEGRSPGVRGPVFERAMSEAGRAYRLGTAEGKERALDSYKQAAVAGGTVRQRATALYAVTVLKRLLDDNAAALASAEQVLPLWKEVGDRTFVAYTLNEIGLNRWLLGEVPAAREAFSSAADHSREAGDPFVEAVAASNLCLMDLVDNLLRPGLECYREALPLLTAAGAPTLEGDAQNNVGQVYNRLGEPLLAAEHFEAALRLKHLTGDRKGEARIRSNLALLHQAAGRVDDALADFGRALDLFRELDDQRWQARVLGNLAFLYLELGEPQRAQQDFELALELRRRLEDPRGTATTLNNLSRVALALEDIPRALDLQQQALEIFRRLEDRRGEALALEQLGQIQQRGGQVEAARASFSAAESLLRHSDDPVRQARLQRRLGEVDLELGKVPEARQQLASALRVTRQAGHGLGEAETLFALARTERVAGRPEAALETLREAVEALDELRLRIGPPDLRASFSSLRHDAYELWVELLMERHRAEPEAGWNLQALAAADGARARVLVELLRESGVRVSRTGSDDTLLERLEAAEDRLGAKIERGLRLAPESPEAVILADERREILREIDLLTAAIRRQSPFAAELIRPRALSVENVQRRLDEDTIVLYYALGAERSFLWRLTHDRVASFELPGRQGVEQRVRELHRQLADFDPSDRRRQAQAAGELGDFLLGPVASGLAGERLIVVADGALNYLPFSALTLDDGAEEPPWRLVDRHQVSYLPSLSTLVAALEEAETRRPASGELAVFADPVFDLADDRLRAAEHLAEVYRGGAGTPGRTAGSAPGRVFERLPASRREAEAIASLAAPGRVLEAYGFAASRERALSGELEDYRVIHFATHGVIDAEQPALSGLALSLVAPDGGPRQGFLGLRDIYRMRLAADLIVLSGCRTAMGREMRGEGLVGLVQGFFHAGARQVVASLWPVEDRATAELMTHFYRALWQEGDSPAAALRRAQLEMQRNRRFRDPAHWAGFVLVEAGGVR